MITYSNAINCFTDASCVNRNGVVSSCAGYVLTYQDKVIEHDERVLYNTSNNYGECYAVMMGVQALLRYAHYDTFLNLFSDSKITIEGLRTWCTSWVKAKRDGVFYSSSGKPVANQEIFKYIIGTIAINGIHMQLFHVLGHKSPSSLSNIKDQKHNFNLMNNTLICDEIARELCYYNGLVDNNTRDALMAVPDKELPDHTSPIFIFDFVIDEKVVKKHLKMLADLEKGVKTHVTR